MQSYVILSEARSLIDHSVEKFKFRRNLLRSIIYQKIDELFYDIFKNKDSNENGPNHWIKNKLMVSLFEFKLKENKLKNCQHLPLILSFEAFSDIF